jgi:hypothetical protein
MNAFVQYNYEKMTLYCQDIIFIFDLCQGV